MAKTSEVLVACHVVRSSRPRRNAILTGTGGLTVRRALALVMELGDTEAVVVTVTVKSPVSLVLSLLTMSVGVCDPETTLMSPGWRVTGWPWVKDTPLKFH